MTAGTLPLLAQNQEKLQCIWKLTELTGIFGFPYTSLDNCLVQKTETHSATFQYLHTTDHNCAFRREELAAKMGISAEVNG